MYRRKREGKGNINKVAKRSMCFFWLTVSLILVVVTILTDIL